MSNGPEKTLMQLEKSFDATDMSEKNENELLSLFQKDEKPFKIYLGIFKGNYFKVFLSILFCALKYLPVIFRPIFTAKMIDLAVDAIKIGSFPDWKKLILYFSILLALIIVNIPLNYLETVFYSKAVRSTEASLRSAMVRRLQHLSISFHNEMESGRIQSKVMRDVENIDNMTVTFVNSYVGVLCTFFAALIVTITHNIIVFLMYLFLVPVAVIIIMTFRNSLKFQNRAFRKEYENTSARVIEMVEMIPVTKAHALENVETRNVNRQLKKVARKGYALDILQSFFGSIVWGSTQTFELICLVVTVIFAFKNIITVGEITLYSSYFSTIVASVCSIVSLLPILTSGFESVKSIGDIFGSIEYEDNNGKESVPTLSGKYEFKNVSFFYPNSTRLIEKMVLSDLDLTVNPGETIALVGESGSGKTTILNLVLGFYKPTKGTLLIDGTDATELDLHSYRKHISMVPQTSILFSGTIRENITYGSPNVTEEQLWNAIRAANLEDVIKKLPDGIDTDVGEHGNKLSGGQRQRVSIARAIIRKPDVIIFDEATSALDSVSEKLIQESIDYLCKDKTTFIVAHRLSTIRNADKIAVIANGRCVEYGTYEELMEKKGEFYKYKILQT